MDETKVYTLEEANNLFAKIYNGACWSLMSKEDRTPDDTAIMIDLAHASLLHWRENKAGTPANLQRGEFLVSTAYALAGRAEPALYHAKKCLDHSLRSPEAMSDFDIAYAYMAMARALALAGSEDEAKEYLSKMTDAAGKANEAADKIGNEADKQLFEGDLKMGDWYFLADQVAAYGQGRPKNKI